MKERIIIVASKYYLNGENLVCDIGSTTYSSQYSTGRLSVEMGSLWSVPETGSTTVRETRNTGQTRLNAGPIPQSLAHG